MKTVMIKKSQQVISRLSHLGCGAILLLACGCSKTAPEPEPVVSVQVEPAKRGPITETISAEAVVFPVQQSVIAPKITSTVRTFYVQRGSRVKKGQELVQLENADLTAAAEQSKGDFEQAQASYAATTGATIPEQVQKAELDAAAAKSNYDA